MPRYNVLFFDAGQRIRRMQQIDCPDDDSAIERLARLQHAFALELRQGERLVWRFEPPSRG